MAEAENSPIVILDEDDDDEDDDDIVVLKEEKVAIPADDDNDDEVIFIAQSRPSTSISPKNKDSDNPGSVKSEPASSKELTRSLSLTSSFDLSLTLTGPLDLSKHTERDDGDDSVQNSTTGSSVKLADKESSLVDLEEADSQQSLTDDLLDSVAGSSLDSSLVGPVSPSVDSDNSNDSTVSMPTATAAAWPVKWSPQPSTSGVKTNLPGSCSSSSDSSPSKSSSASAIDEFLELLELKTYDQASVQSPDNQSCMSSSVTPPPVPAASQTVGAAPTNIHSVSCDTTKSSSPIGLSVSNNVSCSASSSTASSGFKPILPSQVTTNHRYSSSQDDTLLRSSPLANSHPDTGPFPALSVHKTNATSVNNSTITPVPKVKILPKPVCVSSGPSLSVASTSASGSSSSPSSQLSYSLPRNSSSGLLLGCGSSSSCGSKSGASPGSASQSGSGISSYKLAQYSLPPRKRVRPDIKVPDTLTAKSEDACVNCKCILQDLKVSRCTQGHPACLTCLEDQVKLILTDKQGSLKCIMVSCGSYYPMSELKHTLPSMVVEILEDKLHKDYINFVADMMLKDTGDTSDQAGTSGDSSSSKSTKAGSKGDDSSSPKKQKLEDDVLQLFEPLKGVPEEEGKPPNSPGEDHPPNWEVMDKMNFVILSLEPESDEYVDVALKFHSTLAFPTADIVKISRVQNPILWKYYQLKRTEMIHENDGLMVDERQLFHGTNCSVIEAICRKGFDWRVCGKHGSVYGQGSYFAKASSYSHQYTDKQSGGSGGSSNDGGNGLAGRLRSRLVSYCGGLSALSNPSQGVLRPNQGRVLLGPFNQMQVNQLLPPHLLPPPAHMPLSSSILSGIHGQPPLNNSAAPPPYPNRNNLANNLTIITSNNISGPLPTSSSNPVLSSTQSMPPLSSLPSSTSGNTPRGYTVTSLGGSTPSTTSNPSPAPGCSTMFSNSNINSTVHQFISFNRQGQGMETQPPSLPNNAQKSTKDPKSRVLSVSDIASSSSRKMFLAKVLVGKYTGGNSSHRRPPPFYPSEPYGKCYDSCVDNIWDPKIFVIFDSNQAYPEYIVEYNVMNE